MTNEETMTQSPKPHGAAAIDAMFARAKSENRAAFLPYFCIGYPDYDESLRAIASVADLGVDGFEIGIPFSDHHRRRTHHPGPPPKSRWRTGLPSALASMPCEPCATKA